MRCKVCHMPGCRFLWHDDDGSWWGRCLCCGSDSSTTTYEEVQHRYNADYANHNLRTCGSRAALLETMRSNLDRFPDDVPTKTFLDVGCLEGCAMEGMRQRGWRVSGFDVLDVAPSGFDVVAANRLDRLLFHEQYGAVMAREVIEHVEDWWLFLTECYALTLPGGVFQVQTPRPCVMFDSIPYHWAHLQLFAPYVLQRELKGVGFEIENEHRWSTGQLYLCRRPKE